MSKGHLEHLESIISIDELSKYRIASSLTMAKCDYKGKKKEKRKARPYAWPPIDGNPEEGILSILNMYRVYSKAEAA